jgi:hypothetical protein
MKTIITLILIAAALTSCGTPYNVSYIDPATGIAAGYSSKGGIVINYQPLRDK